MYFVRSSNDMKCMIFLQDSDRQSSLDWQESCCLFDETIGISRETCIPIHKLCVESLRFTLALQNPIIRKDTQMLGVIWSPLINHNEANLRKHYDVIFSCILYSKKCVYIYIYMCIHLLYCGISRNTILYYIYIVYSLMFVLVRSVSLGGPISEVDLSKSVSARPNANS